MPTRIAVVGAGGLGGPICYALAKAGAEVQLFDADTIDASNLHRQIWFGLADVGQAKASTLARRLTLAGGAVTAVDRRWTAAEADELCADRELIIDGSDDPATKFAVADWATATGRTSVIAGALGHGGNVFISAPGHACFRCLFEEVPDEAPTCADAGVLGPAVAQVAAIAAAQALALATGAREDAGTIWILEDVLRGTAPRRVAVAPRHGCPSCAASPLPPLRTTVQIA